MQCHDAHVTGVHRRIAVKAGMSTWQGIQGVRFKRLIMDESAKDRSPHPPQVPEVKRAVFCSGKVRSGLSPSPCSSQHQRMR